MRRDKTKHNDYTISLNSDVGDAIRSGVRVAVGAGFGRGCGVLPGGEVGVDVDQFDGAGRVAHWQDLFGVPADAVVALGDDPAFLPEGPEGVVQGGGEFVDFGNDDERSTSPGLAVDAVYDIGVINQRTPTCCQLLSPSAADMAALAMWQWPAAWRSAGGNRRLAIPGASI